MNEKQIKIFYWVSTGLLSLMMLFQHSMISVTLTKLGYPAYIIYPLAIAKILGIIAILSKKSSTLKELAYS